MFLILEEYAPTLVPYSIDEGFLDFTSMDEHVWHNTTATDYVQGIRARIKRETRLPVTAGLGNSAKLAKLAKLATDAAKGIGFLEVPAGQEKAFLKDRPVSEMSGIGKNRQCSLAALGAFTFGHVAALPSMLLKQKFGIWGQQLWLFSNGQWNEPLVLEIKDRTTISSSTTLPHDEHDYEAALTFMLSEATRLTGQLRRELMQAREFSVAVRFNDFTEVGTSHRFKHPQFLNSVINTVLEAMFRDLMADAQRPVRQIRIDMYNLERLDTHPTLWGRTNEERWGALDDATQELNEKLGKTALMTGAQFALQHIDESQKQPKAKCPFTPQRVMITKLWGDKPLGLPAQGVFFESYLA
jgi:DNA polymerase-4